MLKLNKVCPYCENNFELSIWTFDMSKCRCSHCSEVSTFKLKLSDYVKILFILLVSCILFFTNTFFGLQNRYFFFIVCFINVVIALLLYYRFGSLKKI